MMAIDKQFDVLLKDIYHGCELPLTGSPTTLKLAKELRRFASTLMLLEVEGQPELGQQLFIATLDAAARALEMGEGGDLKRFLAVLRDANYSEKEVDDAVQSVFSA